MKHSEHTWDRWGIIASVACAAHCMVAPLIFLLLPKFASIWAHPASHALVALFVLPMAGTVLRSGYRKHGRKWVAASALIGIGLIVVGSALPYIDKGSAEFAASETVAEDGTSAQLSASGEGTVDTAEEATEEGCSACASCCPQIVEDEDGETRLVLPAASIVTLLGSFFLITSHLGNLVAVRCCRREENEVSSS